MARFDPVNRLERTSSFVLERPRGTRRRAQDRIALARRESHVIVIRIVLGIGRQTSFELLLPNTLLHFLQRRLFSNDRDSLRFDRPL